MTPDQFIAKWRAADLTERAGSQAHFIDLCATLGVKAPYADDPTDQEYAFEKGAAKTGGGDGWADVWKRGCFGWEYKGKRRNLDEALKQLQQYALALENPPLLIVSDMERFRVTTNWTSTVSKTHEFELEDLRDGARRDLLKNAFSTSTVERLKPGVTRQSLTEDAATRFADLAQLLRARGHAPESVAHFIQRLVFCMFAEDVKLLPDRMFVRMLEAARDNHGDFVELSRELFRSMAKGGRIGLERVAHFNGGLFEDDATLPLEAGDVKLLIDVAGKDWSDVDPTIFGTLFERGLDPDKRSQLGAHYTDPDKIMRIVEPVVIRPLRAEWDAAHAQIAEEMAYAAEQDRKRTSTAKGEATKAINRATALYKTYLDRIRAFRVLDPACGSGNFLYLSLHALMDLEHRAGIDVERLGLKRELPGVGPESVRGIEINPYAAELARVTIWIGWLQWMRRNGFTSFPDPILSVLDQIECRDAVLNADGTEAQWPAADAIVGNPPFLGGKLMRATMGDAYVNALFAAYEDVVPAEADLVCYWVKKAWDGLDEGAYGRVGLVTTNSIRGGANRVALDEITEDGRIFDAWSDEPWVVDGAAVRVALVCFDKEDGDARLDGADAGGPIRADLTTGGADLTKVRRLSQNLDVAFQGPVKVGAFDIPGELARLWLLAPENPNNTRNGDALRPWANGQDIVRRPSDTWIVDFGEMPEAEAAYYELPFRYVESEVKPGRLTNNDRQRRENWWRLGRSGSDLKRALESHTRQILTPRVAKHRLFVFASARVLPDSRLFSIVRDDDTTFGILQSIYHEAWTLRTCSWHGVGNDPTYNAKSCFETFPFPEGLTPDIPAAQYANDPRAQAIAAAAKDLHEKREAWLNPADLVDRTPEVVAGYPDRLIPKSEAAAAILKKRTLTALYNERPAWLAHLHDALDAAVAAAYGWPADISNDAALDELFKLNQARSA